MNILALDCATRTGWATLIDGNIESGVQDFTKKRGESNGMMFLRFNGWLDELHASQLFTAIYYEQAHHRGGAATEICVNLTGRVQEYAARRGIECCPVHTATIKKNVIGTGRASKDEIMAWFQNIVGYPPIDDNEADARALLEYAMMDLHVEAR